MPITFLPYMFFSRITSNRRQTFSSLSESRSKGKPYLALNFSCEATESREMPSTTVFWRRNFGWSSANSCPSVVQPGVLSFG